jgi:hypothetical protein
MAELIDRALPTETIHVNSLRWEFAGRWKRKWFGNHVRALNGITASSSSTGAKLYIGESRHRLPIILLFAGRSIRVPKINLATAPFSPAFENTSDTFASSFQKENGHARRDQTQSRD